MRRPRFRLVSLVRLLLLLAAAPVVLAQSGQTGQVQITGTETVSGTGQIKLQLVNCGIGIPRAIYNGAFVSTQVQTTYWLTVSSGVQWSQYVWPNDAISCAGTVGNTLWQVTYIQNGVPVGQPESFDVVSTINPYNTTVQTPASQMPPPQMPSQSFTFHDLTLNAGLTAASLTANSVHLNTTPTQCQSGYQMMGYDQNLNAACTPAPIVTLAGGGTLTGPLAATGFTVGTRSTISPANEAALTAAITANCGGYGSPGYVALSPGLSITITSSITTIPSYCTIDWGGVTFNLANGANITLIALSNVTQVHFKGTLNVNGNSANQTAGTYADLVSLSNVTDSDFENMYLSSSVDTCLSLLGSSRNKFAVVDARSCGVTNLNNANLQGSGIILDQGSSDNQFRTAYVDTNSGRAGISVSGEVATPSDRNEFDMFTVKNSAQKGVQVWGAAPNSHFGIGDISNTGANENGAGFYASPDTSGGNPDYLTIGSITCESCGNNGFEITANHSALGQLVGTGTLLCTGTCTNEGAAAGVYIGGNYDTASSIVVTNNAGAGMAVYGSNNAFGAVVARDNGSASPGTYAGIQVSGYLGGGTGNTFASIVSGNTSTSNQQYGLEEANGATGNTFGVANLTGNVAGPALISTGSSLLAQVTPSGTTYTTSATLACPMVNVPMGINYGNSTAAITFTLPTGCPTNSIIAVTNVSSGTIKMLGSGPPNNLIIPGGKGMIFAAAGSFWYNLTPAPLLTATTPTFGGSPVTAPACVTQTVTVVGADSSTQHVGVTPTVDPNGASSMTYDIYGYVSGTDTVTVKVCPVVAGAQTPGATTYNVVVNQNY